MQWECRDSAFTPGPIDSAVDFGFDRNVRSGWTRQIPLRVSTSSDGALIREEFGIRSLRPFDYWTRCWSCDEHTWTLPTCLQLPNTDVSSCPHLSSKYWPQVWRKVWWSARWSIKSPVMVFQTALTWTHLILHLALNVETERKSWNSCGIVNSDRWPAHWVCGFSSATLKASAAAAWKSEPAALKLG